MSHGSASGGVATPAQRFVLAFKLSHESSATTTELVSIRETLCYVKTQPPHFWTIFCDLMSALQSLMWVMQRSRCGQLAFDIFSTLCGLLQSGHQVAFKWILVHCGVPGNESADAAAKAGHNAVTRVDILLATPDARVVVRQIAIMIVKAWWNDLRSHHPRFYSFDPSLRFRVPSNRSFPFKIIFHRQCHGVAYTREY